LGWGNVVRWAGVCLFFAGMAVNVMSDEVLRNLRRDDNNAPAAARPPAAAAAAGKERDGTTTAANEGRDGTTTTTKDGTEEEEEEAQHHHNRGAYYVPRSPLFAIVSCPNFLGEIIEWFGYSMASTFSLPSVAFFAYTACNLIPRAVAHHEWYLRKFDDYPIERKWAVIPLVV
jgi:steroid 5-alpha reductase family enzyme